ncbi:MAG: 4-hydroxy-3-methylbut-2-enyl diphosphate reductase, partial [Lachnospiraceae bacterium]|nr:4-hydroxy-3-methylbut-2-enyl diphosphate reductase [Lachnospiraceae bacterium]
MKVITASTAGFCFGVKRAVDLAKQAAADNEHGVLTYGPLIHNASVIADLEKRNIRAVDPEDDAPSDSEENTILIRAHGVGRETERQLKESYGKVVDATCPFVKKIHQIVAEESEKGWTIIIIGSPNHPEVIGISGWTNGDYYVVENVSDAEKLPFFGDQRVCVVAQTTF